jgi:CRP-like cAMP-binding protein
VTERVTEQALAAHNFLGGLSEPSYATLASLTKRASAAPGEFLGREGESADALYLIESGLVALEVHTPDRGAVRIQTIGPGEVVGWSWFLPPHRWQFDARAIEPIRALAIDGHELRTLCEQNHELGYQLLKRLVAVVASRLAATRLQLLDVYK